MDIGTNRGTRGHRAGLVTEPGGILPSQSKPKRGIEIIEQLRRSQGPGAIPPPSPAEPPP
jgi:hypothetical protein